MLNALELANSFNSFSLAFPLEINSSCNFVQPSTPVGPSFSFKSEGIGSGYQMGTTFVLAEIDDGRP